MQLHRVRLWLKKEKIGAILVPPFRRACSLQTGSQQTVVCVSTVGLGGVFISTSHPPEPGAIVRLIFSAPQGDVRAMAIVRSSEKGKGMGVEFTSMNSTDRGRLHQLLKQLLGESKELRNEPLP
jgi:hypothetical protein